MVAALALGAIGSIIIARTDTIGQAIAGQAIAGVAGINQALPQAVTSEVLPRRFRPYAQVLINIPGGVAAAVGTYLAGVMTRGSPEGFRNYFYLVMALYVFSASIIVSTYQPPTRELQCLALREKLYRLDLPGCLLLAVGLLGVSLALCWSSNPYSWKNAHVLAPLIIGLCSMVILTLYAVFYRKDGIFHHGLFKRRNFWVSELCFLGEGVAFIAANMYLGQQLELMYGASSWEVALVFGVAWWTWAASAPLCGWFIVKTQRAKVVIVVALASFTLYFALMAATNLSTRANIWGYNVFLVSPELIAPATGLIVATRTFGACMGINIFSAILNSAVSRKLVPSVSRAAEAAGLPASSLEPFISALNGNHPDALASVPGVTDQVIQAATTASRKVYNLGFRNGYAAAAAFTTFAMFAALGLKDINMSIAPQLTLH
ncbi:uncharacterized protein PV06_10820 [Exophiala oligosperma]|uniref:Major facilitator superfamily (MFS) profile domain-containing protein n=1 Tax=Exophiala oligosperma TaxID=215243 RepID=A0A0D2A9A9_9EURO|nr:uncharacterized protein PV06_10820 [Exophiala oligosperma]KIW36916.1 hypothetical protein PV06_10820 [Exophiala oligosperma]